MHINLYVGFKALMLACMLIIRAYTPAPTSNAKPTGQLLRLPGVAQLHSNPTLAALIPQLHSLHDQVQLAVDIGIANTQ